MKPSDLETATRGVVAWGGRLPCWGPELALWLSEDPHERAAAGALCRDCPVLDACRTEGRRHKFGVWGGRDRTKPQEDS